ERDRGGEVQPLGEDGDLEARRHDDVLAVAGIVEHFLAGTGGGAHHGPGRPRGAEDPRKRQRGETDRDAGSTRIPRGTPSSLELRLTRGAQGPASALDPGPDRMLRRRRGRWGEGARARPAATFSVLRIRGRSSSEEQRSCRRTRFKKLARLSSRPNE